MSVQHYLKMIDHASVAQRCHAAVALAHLLLHSELDSDERDATEAVLTLLLDDPSPKVRLALADAFSTSAHAPAHIVASLARDQIEIASFILGRSALLTDLDLIDCVAGGNVEIQKIIAARPNVSLSVSATIIEIGEKESVLRLLANRRAQIAAVSFRRLIDRFGHFADVRAALVEDERLPSNCRHSLAIRIAEALSEMDIVKALIGERRVKRLTDEACVLTAIQLADVTPVDEYPVLIEHLQLRGDITTAFIVRLVASGRLDFFAAIIAALSGYAPARVRNVVFDGRRNSLIALLCAAGVAESAHAPLVVAVQTWRSATTSMVSVSPCDVTRTMLEAVTERAGNTVPQAANDDLAVLLKRIHLDAMRENARNRSSAIAAA